MIVAKWTRRLSLTTWLFGLLWAYIYAPTAVAQLQPPFLTPVLFRQVINFECDASGNCQASVARRFSAVKITSITCMFKQNVPAVSPVGGFLLMRYYFTYNTYNFQFDSYLYPVREINPDSTGGHTLIFDSTASLSSNSILLWFHDDTPSLNYTAFCLVSGTFFPHLPRGLGQ